MRALLFALLLPISILGCGSKTDADQPVAAKPSGETAAMSVEGNSAGSASGAPDKPVEATPPPAGYTGGSAAQETATDVEQAKNVAKVEAATAKENADDNTLKANAVAHAKLQTDFDESDRRFTTLKEKAATATGATKKKADAAIADITKREATIMAGIAKLRNATVAQWNALKPTHDANTAAFNKAIDALEVTLR